MLTLQNLRWSGKQLLSAILQILQHNLRSGWTRAFGPRNSARYFGLTGSMIWHLSNGVRYNDRKSYFIQSNQSRFPICSISSHRRWKMTKIQYIPQWWVKIKRLNAFTKCTRNDKTQIWHINCGLCPRALFQRMWMLKKKYNKALCIDIYKIFMAG